MKRKEQCMTTSTMRGRLHRRRAVTLGSIALGCLMLLVSACSAGADGAGSGGDGEDHHVVRLAQVTSSFVWLPYYVAEGAGFFEEVGVEVEQTQTSSGTTGLAAVLAGDADVVTTGTQQLFDAHQANQDPVAFVILNDQFTSTVVVSDTFYEGAGLTDDSSITERLEALATARIAVSATGSTADVLLRFALQSAGVDTANLDVTPVGNIPAIAAQLREGRVDATPSGPPLPQMAEADGYGRTLLNPLVGDLPALEGMAAMALVSTPDAIEENEEALIRFTAAIQRAMDLIHSDFEAAAEAAEAAFPELSADVVLDSVTMMEPSIPDSVMVDEQSLSKALDIYGEAKESTYEFPVSDTYTNELSKKAIEFNDE